MSEPRWLTDQEAQLWVPIISMMMKVPAVLDGQLQRDAGMSHFDYGILVRLSEAPEQRLQMSVLASLTNGSLSRLSHAVRKLEERGWVARSLNPADRRLTEATLTTAGRAKLEAAAPGHVTTARRLIIDALSPAQLKQLGRLADTVVANLDASEHSSPY